MTPDRWEQVQALFHEAVELEAEARHRYLDAACGEDAELRSEVEALLRADDADETMLDRDLGTLADGILEEPGEGALPEVVGPYRILRMLGEGGMGVVLLAEREDVGQRVALKVLRDAWVSPTRRSRFASERRTLAQLNHPAIAQLFDAGTLPDGTPWFAMEHVEGLPLTDYCREHRTALPDRLRLFRGVCEAVQHAHRHAVIHRDLKPSNILVTADGSIKLLDFGIAKQLDTPLGEVEQTRTGLRLMTPAYAAPEQVTGDRIGLHTDVYSLGVILYELLAGRLPFDLSGATPSEASAILLGQNPARPSTVARVRRHSDRPPGATPGRSEWADLDVLCLTAMHKEPTRRYAGVDALIRDVDHFLRGEPLDARPDSSAYKVGKFVRRNRIAVSLAVGVAASVIGLVGFYTLRLGAARDAAVEAAARTQRVQGFLMNLFQGGDPAMGPADSLHVVTLLDRGVQEAAALGTEPVIQGELFETLGQVYQQLGEFTRADSLLQTSLDVRRTALGGSHPDVASSLVALGALRIQQAEFEEAERLIREGMTLARARLPASDPRVANATSALGKVLEERGEYAEAITVLGEAVRLHESQDRGENPELATALLELANSHFYAGNLEDADSLSRVVLAMGRRLYGEGHPFIAEELVNLGAVQYEWGRFDEAERYYREALALTRAWYGEDHHKTASNLTMLGRALVALDRDDDAMTVLSEALTVQERSFGRVHPAVASTLNDLGTIALRRDRLDLAADYFGRMRETYRQVYPAGHWLVGIAASNLSNVYGRQGNYTNAERLLREAVDQFARFQSPTHTNTAIGRIKLGRVLRLQGRHAEAAEESGAGYEILKAQPNPMTAWLRYAATDLAQAFDQLGRPERAAEYRLAMADSASGR